MWINKSEWDLLRSRIEQLEKAAMAPEKVPTIHLGYIGSLYPWGDMASRYRINVTHQEAILRILDHLGLSFEKVEGAPAYVKLVPKSQAA